LGAALWRRRKDASRSREAAGDATVAIREGMTLTVGHRVLAVPRVGGVRLEDTFRISVEGVEPLTEFPVEMTDS
jgi:Xaa-Pro aminopeptidase